MPASLRIQHLQWIVGAGASFACVVLGGTDVANHLTDLHRTGRAVTDASRFGLIMAAADTISAERGPANAAMDPLAAPSEERRRALAAIRAETDRRLKDARAAFGGVDGGRLDRSFAAVGDRLAAARAEVDAVVARDPQQRGGPAIARAIEAMFAVADEAAGLRAESGRRLLTSAPQIGVEVMLEANASALREQAGRLGSYAVMLLTGGLGIEEARVAAARTEGRIRQLWLNLTVFGRAFADDGVVGHALADVEAAYFGESLPLARSVFADDTPRMSATVFTGRYVPGLAAPTRLKDSLETSTRDKINAERETALVRMLMASGMTAAVVLALAWLALVFRRRLFRPLLAVREDILALSVGRLEMPGPRPRYGREVEEMFAGLAVLRSAMRRKLVLERARRRMLRSLKHLSETDALTGLLNRHALARKAPAMLEAAGRDAIPVSAILVDIDHFKAVNDQYGHAGGDAVLKRAAAVLTSLVGPHDLVVRYGGEEFLVLAPGLDGPAAADQAEAMRRALSAMPAEREAGPAVTASFGIASRQSTSAFDWEALIARADAGLYRAKRMGRNRVCHEAPEAPASGAPLALTG